MGVRAEAVLAIGAAAGPEAAWAVPALGEHLGDPDVDVRAAVAFAIGKLGPHLKPSKLDMLLGKPDKERLVNELARVLSNYNDRSADAAGEALVGFGGLGLEAVLPLVERPPFWGAWGGNQTTARERAIRLLPRFGEAASGAAPRLRVIVLDRSDALRAPAMEAMARVAGREEQTWWAIYRVAAGDGGFASASERAAAEAALRSLGPDGGLVRFLAAQLRIESAGGPANTLLAAYSESAAPVIVPALIEQLPKADIAAKTNIVRLLGRFGAASRQAAPMLVPLTASGFQSLRLAALDALAQIGPDAAPAATGAVVRLLGDSSPMTRGAAAYSLTRLAPDSGVLAVELRRAVKDHDWTLCIILASAARSAPGADAGRAELLEIARRDAAEEVRSYAWYAARSMGVPVEWLFRERRAAQ
jgi:HEAT repeat protein